MKSRLVAGLSFVVACLGLRAAELIPVAEIPQEIRKFAITGTVLHVAAHPDDENTELITYLSLGRGYRTAYLSITRGDGGQNELGKDFDEKLGVLRTQELLAARRLDHGRQFFTRAIDFGFSKSPEEALAIWDHEAVLSDVVRIIRQFHPDVIVTRFPVPPGSGGHGHHTASAILAVEAFKLAGDPKAFPEQLAQGLTVWQPKRVLWNFFRFGAAGPGALDGPVFKQDIAGTDPVSGEEFGNIAARSRSMHRTQGLAGAVNRARTGPNEQSFMLLAGDPATADLMDGVDTTWARYPTAQAVTSLARGAADAFKPDDPAASLPALLAIHRTVAALPRDPLVDDKLTQLDRIIQSCLGLTAETVAERADVVPGEKLKLTTTIRLAHGAGSTITHASALGSSTTVRPGEPVAQTVELAVPATLPFTHPYWLREDPVAGLSRVADPKLIGRPESLPTLSLRHEFMISGERIVVEDEPLFIEANGRRAALEVIPSVSLALNSAIYLLAPGTSKTMSVEVTAHRPGARGIVRLELPAGWSAAPAEQSFALDAADAKTRLEFKLTAPAQEAAGRVTAWVETGGRRYSAQHIDLNYAHLPNQLLQPPARARVASFTLATKGQTVGYLPGAGDSLTECMEQMGYVVHPLTGADLTPEKLKGLDAVVIGVRAFNDRTDLKDALPGLFAWVEQGGTVIAQYNRTDRPLKAPTLGPYPITIQEPASRQRVTVETAPVTILVPDHAALNTPNKIRPADFDGWVQERGTYFPMQWDEEHYTALFAMNDPGEAPLRGSVLIARHGKGHYVYTGLAFFRQLPAGVPGAYRLFENLLALGK